jgi:ABC-type transporter Mla subunit MlaD
MLADGGRLPDGQVEGTTQLDEILSAFDKPTRTAFQEWQKELARAFKGGRGQDLNDALGNLEGFSVDGARLLRVLDDQGVAVRRLIRNTGQTFGAINERRGALRELVTNANNTFQATASQDQALADTVEVLPTFLAETRATLARLDRFARDTRPLVRDLKGPATDLGPTVHDLGALAPDLERFFRDVTPLERASRAGLPDLERVLRGAEPLAQSAHPFLRQLNPILSFLNFDQAVIAAFISDGAANIPLGPDGYRQINIAMFDPRTFQRYTTRPPFERGNSYAPAELPNYLNRASGLGVIESFDCAPSGGEKRDPVDTPSPGEDPQPPCFVQPPSLYDHKKFTRLRPGRAPNVRAPTGRQGVTPARP